MLLLMPVTLVAAVFALSKIGGMRNFIERAPRHFWHWGDVANSKLIALWIFAMLIKQWAVINNMTDASRYLNVKDSRHARRAAMLGTILFIIGPIIWFLPPMIARIALPDLRQIFPGVKNPQETAYFAMGVTTLPVGMIGLLISGIFATTLGQMDTGLNRNAGYFIKNFYQVILRPRASERELLFASKIATIAFGLLIILATLWFASMKDLTIFDLMVNFGSWVALPISIPLIWGMFIRRAPNWAGWTCVLITLVVSYLTQKFLTPAWLGHVMSHALNRREASDWAQAAGVLINVLVGSGWFILTPLLARSRAIEEAERVDRFFEEMRTPVDFAKEEGAGSDNLQAKIMGRLCLTYGGFITLLALIPNPWTGRLAFVFCGMVMFGIGWILHRASRRQPVGSSADVGRATEGPGFTETSTGSARIAP
jgi:Na+/proline symporter